jgi:hypothetical protein
VAGANQQYAAPGGVEQVRADLMRAADNELPSLFRDDPEPGKPRNGVAAGQWTPDALGLPPDCPAIPLGFDGKVLWLLDPTGQICDYRPPFNQAETALLFIGRLDYLKWAWPKFKKVGENDDGSPIFKVEGWKNEDVRDAFIQACGALGPWNAVDRVRGRGAWCGADGELIVHCGRKVILPRMAKPQPPGMIDEHVYPARPAIPGPDPGPLPQGKNPAKLLRPFLESWNWRRGCIDAHLMLGWIGVAFLSGALQQRPICFVVGDKGVGKSTLQKFIKALFRTWIMDTVDTTAAGIYQRMGQDALPVAIDEFEGKADTRKAKAVLELARASYSGGDTNRGGDRHQGVTFEMRSAFLFSSINTPPLEPQDLSRMAFLHLQRLRADTPSILPSDNVLGQLGNAVLRRLIDQWPRFPETLAAFREELGRNPKFDARAKDTFGTLLACADMIEFDGWDEEKGALDRLRANDSEGDNKPWHTLLDPTKMVEFEDASENWQACLDHMLSVPVEAWRGGQRRTVGQILEAISAGKEDDVRDVTFIRRELAAAGLGFIRRSKREGGDWLAVPNQDPALRKLFDGTKWAGEPGASVWQNALRQAPKGEIYEVDQTRINGRKCKVTLIKLAALYGPGGIMTDDDPPDPSAMGSPLHPDPMLT